MNQYLNFSLEGKVALVTGASYGIGFAIASAFAEQGATICFNDINQELVDKGLASYAEKGIKAHGYVCDVTDEPAVQAMVATIAKEVGTIDILVNNAGIIRRVPMHEMEAADFRRVIDIDLNAPFIVSKAVLPAMMEKGHGKIINICSMMSELGRDSFPDPFFSARAAAKLPQQGFASYRAHGPIWRFVIICFFQLFTAANFFKIFLFIYIRKILALRMLIQKSL